MHEVLVNRLVMLAQEKTGLNVLTVITIAVDWGIKPQNGQNTTSYLEACKEYR